LFIKVQDMTPELLPPDRLARAEAIAAGLPDSEIIDIERHVASLRIADVDGLVTGDVTTTGFTVYLGGFDWVTYPSPPHLLARFPDLMPLPQQVFSVPEEDL
jgi:hypothetical protein